MCYGRAAWTPRMTKEQVRLSPSAKVRQYRVSPMSIAANVRTDLVQVAIANDSGSAAAKCSNQADLT